MFLSLCGDKKSVTRDAAVTNVKCSFMCWIYNASCVLTDLMNAISEWLRTRIIRLSLFTYIPYVLYQANNTVWFFCQLQYSCMSIIMLLNNSDYPVPQLFRIIVIRLYNSFPVIARVNKQTIIYNRINKYNNYELIITFI